MVAASESSLDIERVGIDQWAKSNTAGQQPRVLDSSSADFAAYKRDDQSTNNN